MFKKYLKNSREIRTAIYLLSFLKGSSLANCSSVRLHEVVIHTTNIHYYLMINYGLKSILV